MLVLWSRRRTRSSARTVWLGMFGIASLALLNVAVDTPRERLIRSCHTLATLVDNGQVDDLRYHLSTDFETRGLDRAAFVERAEQGLTRYRIDNLTLRGFDVALQGTDMAHVVFTAACQVRAQEAVLDRFMSRWRLTFHLRNDRWRVRKIEILPSPFSPVRDLSQWLP